MVFSQPCKFLVDTVFAKGMTVRQSKEELLPQLKEQCKLDLSIDRYDSLLCKVQRTVDAVSLQVK